jgi:hypothetical protein
MTTATEPGNNVRTLIEEAFDRREAVNSEITEGELDQIAGGVTPSIPIPPPRPSFALS